MSEKKLSPLRQKDIRTGAKQERERIIEVLEQNLYEDSNCECQGCIWVREVISLIKEGTE